MEASTSYYKLYRGFQADHYEVSVANTLQLRKLVAKNDRLDARRLSDMLRLGTMPESFIPGERIQRLRSLVHARHALVEESTRWKNRLHALLDHAGISLSAHGSPFTKRWAAALEAFLTSGEADEVLRYAYEHYQGIAVCLEELTRKMIAATREHWARQHTLLQLIPGIGGTLACYLIAEVWPVSRFASEKKLRRYAGVIPVVKQSGKYMGKEKLPKQSRRGLLCWALVQVANAAGRTKTNLSNYYCRKRRQKNPLTVKMATAASISDRVFKTMSTGEAAPEAM